MSGARIAGRSSRRGLSTISRKKHVAIIVGLLIVFGIGAFVIQRNIVGKTCRIHLPEEAGTLIFRRIPIDKLTRDYFYREVVLSRNGGDGTVHTLCNDFGDGSDVNVYWIKGKERKFVRLEDSYREYLLDMHDDKMYVLVRTYGRVFAGRQDSRNNEICCTMTDDDPTTVQVDVNGTPAVPLESLTNDDVMDQYIGAVSECLGVIRFYPAE